jgi:ketosteroid isomerase-like protein
MTPAEETVRRLYEAVKRHDAAAAAECYCDDASYRDIAFDLTGKPDIAAMWRLVCSREPPVKVEYGNIRTEGSQVKGYWVFDYKFRGINPVHNPMHSTFSFRDGKILVHHDHASRWNWARQALGAPQGALVTVVPSILREKARKELEEFKEKERLG